MSMSGFILLIQPLFFMFLPSPKLISLTVG